MTNSKVSTEARGREAHPYLTSFVALALIVLCVWAAQWQYQRGVDRHHRNTLISQNVDLPSVKVEITKANINQLEWRKVVFVGNFDPAKQILLRNRYNEGKYGFHLLTLFTDSESRRFWVNRGWIAPGANAKSAPQLPATPTTRVEITGRLRLDNSLPQGSFFAMPTTGGSLVEKWNAQSKSSASTEVFYVDLIKASESVLTPAAPVELPELSDGPHMAYALQWIFFGGLVIYGRLLLRRSTEVLTSV
jgi:cytochrome oxidase assembly protein ShyY1